MPNTFLLHDFHIEHKRKGPFRLIVQILQESVLSPSMTEIETYTSFVEAVKDARALYILHKSQAHLQLAKPVDVVVCNSDGDCIYVASHDADLVQ